MHLLASSRAQEQSRTLVAREGAVWIWPGIHLTLRRGGEIVPVAEERICFWVTRLHGPEALYKNIYSGVSRAAWFLTEGNETKAQDALDAIGLVALSLDGMALMKLVSYELGVDVLNLPVRDGPRTWNARDIANHLSFFKESVDAARVLAKGVVPVFDETKHPRWPAGAPESQGGRFAPGDESGGEQLRTGRSIGRLPNPPKVPNEKPPGRLAYEVVKQISRWAQTALELGEERLVHNLILTIEAVQWLTGKPDNYSAKIKASLDEPKTLNELQDAVDDPKPGYEVHHIVERTSAEQDGFSKEEIDARSNLVRIPTMKHYEITGWYQTPRAALVGLTPREYLRGKSFEERRNFGIDVLKQFKVLKE